MILNGVTWTYAYYTAKYFSTRFSRHVRNAMEAWLYLLLIGAFSASCDLLVVDPKFAEPIVNVTVPVGREATLVCVVDDLSTFKIAWLRVDTQTILTIHTHVITKNHRIGVSHSDLRTWYLHIKDVRQSDRGWYMCQINTDPMKSQIGYLDVVVPPDILDNPTSGDVITREGSNVSLRCAASGSPAPNITWKRENGELIPLGNGAEAASVEGPVLNLTKVNRIHMGAYLCIASNGVPPSVSKRIMLVVNFPPVVHIENQLIGAYEGEPVTLECHTEAYPKSINFWTIDEEVVAPGSRYELSLSHIAYRAHMKLTIRSVSKRDYRPYTCVSKNALGEIDGTIQVYAIESTDNKLHTTHKPKKKYKSQKQSSRRVPSSAKNATSSNGTRTDYDESEAFSYEDYNEANLASTAVPYASIQVALFASASFYVCRL